MRATAPSPAASGPTAGSVGTLTPRAQASGRLAPALATLVLAALIVTTLATPHNVLEEYDTSTNGQLDAAELGAMMSHFVSPTFEGESPCPGAADLLVSYDTDGNGELNAAETQVMAFNIMPCVEVFSGLGSGILTVEFTGEEGEEHLLCSAEVGEHEEEQGHTGEEGLSEHGIAIATGATHWHCTDAEPEETSADKPLSNSKAWGYTMAAVLIGSVGCVVILVVVFPYLTNLDRIVDDLGALAVGALFGGSLLHLLPEAVEEHPDGFGWKISSTFIGGFAFALLVEVIVRTFRRIRGQSVGLADHHHGLPSPTMNLDGKTTRETVVVVTPVQRPSEALDSDTAEAGVALSDVVASKPKFSLRTAHPLVWVILIGDGFHNVVDGIAIAAAFLGCEPSIGWSVLLSVMLHEIPQEVGDYCALVKLGMTHWVAVGWNCLSSLAAFIGAWFVLGLNSSDEVVNSYLIAFSAGTLLFIAASDVLPDLLENDKKHSPGVVLRHLLLMAVGVVALGLTLLHHEHCAPGGHAHAH